MDYVCPECGSKKIEWLGDDISRCQDCGHIDHDEMFEV